MEHLIYNPSPRTLRAEIRDVSADGPRRPLQVPDWAFHDRLYGQCAPVEPRVAWLGHDHCGSSYLQSSEYKPLPMQVMLKNCYGREWDIEGMLERVDIYAAHPSLRGQTATDAVASVAAFVQGWLYFGLIEAVCTQPILQSYFVRAGADDGREWLYTRNLGILLESWRRGLDLVEKDFRKAVLRNARDCATTASTILYDIFTKLSAHAKEHEGFSEVSDLIIDFEPGLLALHEAIVAFAERHLRMEVRSFGGDTLRFPRGYSQRLAAKGWCRFVLASAETAMSPSVLRYIDAVGYDKTTGGHEQCNPHECERNRVDLSTYKPEHDIPNCRCRFEKPDLAQVFEILKAGKIPVVQSVEDDCSLQLGAVEPDDSAADYIAFSHVWADGLGSNTEVGLRKCQILRLRRLAGQRLTYGAWFWIDSLCVPSREPYRGKAIELMKLTYQNATGVIVLDKGMRCLPMSAPILEIGWGVFASGWFGRLWTYQEGFLPPWVDLELADGLFDLYGLIQKLYKTYYECADSPFPSVFVRDLLAVLQKVRPLDRLAKGRPKARKLVDTFNALTRRRTSRPDDQLLVMGLLLDVELRDVMRLTGEDRWKGFYLGLREIPWTVLFDRRPKMKSQPFRWAPASWISPGQDIWLHYDEALGVISLDGLTAQVTVLAMNEPRRASNSTLILQADQARYELSHQRASPSSCMERFNVVFVRYFMSETPHSNLEENSQLLMTAGIGLLKEESNYALEYDFASVREIRLLVNDNEDIPSDAETVQAQWKQVEISFT